MDTLFLETGTALEAKVHPVVLFSILDHFLRRESGQTRVIGTLLGSVRGGVVEVRNCFPVTHVEKNGEIAVGKDFNRNMLELHRMVNPKENIVGWYATTADGKAITEFSCLIHDFYGLECTRPLQLSVDTSLAEPKLNVRAFITAPMTVAEEQVVKFQQVRVQMSTSEAERVGLGMMVHGDDGRSTRHAADSTALVSDISGLESAIHKLQTMLRTVSGYVDTVVDGEAEPNISLGRRIADTLAAVPSADPAVFDKMFNDSLQDLLMIVYLSQLTRTQLAITEKLTTASAHTMR